MKIGILTYHRSDNYGALLQAIALREVLKEMGHESTFIDYWPDYHRQMYSVFSFGAMKYKSVIGNIVYVINTIRRYRVKKERIKSFEEYRSKYIYPYLTTVDAEYDVVIHGSDQIWRKQKVLKSYNPVYFGKNNVKAARKISYAASMGVVSPMDEDKEILKDYLSYLDCISVREKELGDLVTELGYENDVSIDPTLLLDKKRWVDMMDLKSDSAEKYVLYYKLQHHSFDDEKIQKFAKSRNLKVKTIYGQARKFNTEENIYIANPKDFLNLILNAEYVFTSSYHGLVFSLLFHKPFYASFNKNSGRAQSLLQYLSLDDRLLTPMSNIPNIENIINYANIDDMIEKERVRSLRYIEDSI